MKTTENIRIRTHCSNLTVAAPAALSATNALAGKWKANNSFLEPRRRVPHPRSVLSMLLSLGVFLALESPALAAIATPTTTTLGMITSPQVYGSTVLSASVVASDLTPVSGNVTFKDSGIVVGTAPVIGGTASLPTKLAVNGGTLHPIQAQFSDPAVVYASSISGVSNVVITARGITVSGSKTYDGGTTVAAGSVSINNSVDGPNLTLSGTAVIAGRNAGPEAILSATYAAPARVQVATFGVSGNGAATFAVTLGRAPTNGNTLVAVIATRGTTDNTITSISQANVTTWKRAAQAANPGNNASGVTTEIWYAPVGASAGTAVTINQTSALRSAAIVLEYSGVLTSAAVDQAANGMGGGTAAVTGTTPSTTLGNELWIGGIAFTNSGQTLGSVLNSFSSVASAQSTYFQATYNSKVYALEKIVSGTGTANSGGTISGPATWAGAIATFYGVPSLSLGGAAAANYTVAGVSGTVTVNPTNLTVTAASNTKPYDGGTSATGTPTITARGLQTGDTTTAFTETYDNKNVGTGKTLTPAGVVNDGNGGANYNYTYAQNFTGVITALQIAPSGQPTNLAVCAGSAAIFSVVVPGVGLTYQWQMSGDGGTTFTNISAASTSACYTNMVPTVADNGNQYQVIVSGAGTPSVTSTQAVLTVNAPATASAGGPQTICAGNDTAALGGTVGGGATGGTWTSSGTGDFNPDATTLNATYTPSMDDLTGTGTVTLTLTTTGQQAPCGAATASVVVTIHAQATAGSGGNQTICAGQSTAALGGFVYGSATKGIWTSSGGGTFTPNATAMNAIYTPSAADISAGAATLTLTTTDQPAPCSPAAVQMVVTIHLAAQVNAGPNQTVCSSSPAATLAGSYGGTATSASWSGAGTFAPNSTAMSAIYTPTAGEITAGHATVTLTSNDPSGPCPAVSATMTITIAQAATASAGGNQTIDADQVTAGLGGTVGGGATGGTWTSSGTGTFAPNASALGAVYHPSAADKTAQTVTLTLTTTGQLTPCTPTTAHLVVTIHALPAITVEPANVTVCAGSSAIFTVTATGAGLTYEWLVSFDFGGSWGDISATATNASYTNPATSLIADDGTLYQVIVSSPWGLSVTSAPPATLTVNEPATVEAGPNQTVCASSLATTLAGSFGGGTTSATWSGAGRFTPNNATLNAVYTPTAGEIAAGTATVALTTDDPPGPCGPASASMTITINPAATVSGGPSQTVCASSPATQLAGSFGGAATGAHWSGAGTFVPNIYVLTPVYTPTAAEIAAGHATVTLTTDDPPGPCPPVSSSMTITINAQPVIMVWNNGAGTGNWNTNDANWNNGSATWDNLRSENAIFAATGIGTVNLTQPITAGSLYFQNPGYTIAGSSLILTGASAITNDADATISAPITSVSLNKWGGSKLTLSGVNTYAGATTIGAGILEYGSPAAVGSTSLITVQNGAEVYFDSACAGATVSTSIALNGIGIGWGALHTFVPGGQITFTGPMTLLGNSQICGQAAASSTVTFNTPIGGSGDLTFIAMGDDGPDQVTFVLGAANTYNGNTYLTNYGATAVVQLTNGGSLPATTTLFMSAGGMSSADSSVFDLNGNNQTLAGLADFGTTAGARSVVNLSGTASTLTLNGAGAHAFSGTVDGNLAVTKSGNGTQTLSGVNTYASNTLISAGTLALSGAGSLASSSSVSLAAGATFDVSAVTGGHYTLGSAATLMASGTASAATIVGPLGGIVDLDSRPIVLVYDGSHPALTVSQGTLSLNGNHFTVNAGRLLGAGYYVVVQQASGDIASAGSYTVSGTAIPSGSGYCVSIVVNGGQVILSINLTPSAPTTVGTSRCGPGVVHLSASGAGGTLKWYRDAGLTMLVATGPTYSPTVSTTTTYYVTETSAAGCVSAASPVTAMVFTGPATANAGPNQWLCPTTPTVQLAGSIANSANGTWSGGSGTFSPNATTLNAVYTPTAAERAAGCWVLTLTADPSPCGGPPAVSTMTWCFVQGPMLTCASNKTVFGGCATSCVTPTRVQSATGNSGSSAATVFMVTLSSAPASGNTLIAVIGTRGSSTGRVTSITQTGVTWSRAAEAANANSSTIEIWYAPASAGAGTVVTINQASLRSAAVVMEYSGVLTTVPVDQIASATGLGTATATGTTPTTTLGNELWIGGISYTNSGATLGTPLNSFNSVASAQSASGFGMLNAKVYALEKMVSATGAASSGGTVSTIQYWSGAIATFKAQCLARLNANWSFDAPKVVDPCCGANYTIITNTVSSGTCCSNAFTRTWQVTDCSNRTATCSQTVTLLDTNPPVISNPTNLTVACGTNWSFSTPTAVDPCCCTKLTTLLTMPLDTNTSTLQITLCLDPKIGSTDLGWECKTQTNHLMGDLVVQLDKNCAATEISLQDFHFTAMAPFVLSFSWSIFGTTIPLTATIGTLDQPVAVHDTYPGTGTPTPINPDGSFTLQNVPFATSTLAYYGGTASGSLDLSGDSVLPTVGGTVHVTNEVATVHMDFSIVQTFNSSGGFLTTGYTVYHATCNASGPVVWTNLAADTNLIVIAQTPVTNGLCPQVITETWIASNLCNGLTATATQTVTVVDTTVPVLTNCNDIVTTATAGMNGAVVLYNVTVTDVCQTNVLLVCTPPSGSFFPCGTNVVVCTATDSCGNSSTCSFKVVVLCPCVGAGNEQLTCASNAPGQLSYSFDLQNNTGLPVNYLLLVPNTNCFTFTPDIITFRPPLPPGQTTNVSVMIHLAGPCASNLCFTLLAQGSSECCYITHCVDRTAGPRLVSALLNCGGNKIAVTFNEPLAPATLLGAPNFIVEDLTHQMSLAFASTTFGADFKTVWLFTVGTLSAGTQYQLTVNNVSDTCGNVIAPNSRLAFSCPDASHRLICTFVNGQFCLSWCCDGVLEFTTALTPPINWAPTPNQSNPQCFPPSGAQKFFRLRQ